MSRGKSLGRTWPSSAKTKSASLLFLFAKESFVLLGDRVCLTGAEEHRHWGEEDRCDVHVVTLSCLNSITR